MEISDEEIEFLKDLGAKLRSIREEKGWTLEETEDYGWPNWRHLQKIETGKNVTLITILRLSKLYDIPMDRLFKN